MDASERFLEGMSRIASGLRSAEPELSSAAEKLVHGLSEQRKNQLKKKRAIREDMSRGARLTKHRISL